LNNKIKILILDDEPIVGERLKVALDRAGFETDVFVSSADAINCLKENRYDILITDIKMSGPDGIEVVRIAKQIYPEIKPVIITGFATKETAEQAKRIGAMEFIPKPFKISELKTLINKLLANSDDLQNR
jgi:DNA-binding NtrC family response regulator